MPEMIGRVFQKDRLRLNCQMSSNQQQTLSMEVESNSTALRFKEQGNAAYKSQDYVKAINCYNKAIKENPNDASFYSNRALCYFNMGKLHQALQDCERSLSLQPNSSKVLRKKCQICLQLLRFEEAEKAAKALVSFEKSSNANNQLEEIESLRSNYERMLKAQQSGDYQQALSCSTHLVNKISGNDKLKMHKAEALLKTGQINQAAAIVNSFSTASSQISYLHGLVALYSGDSDKARRCFSEGLRIDPQSSRCREALNRAKRCEACKQQGNELARKNQWKEAVSRYTQAINLDPYNKKLNSVIYSNRGLAYSKLGQTIKALEDLNKSLELEPNYVKSLLRRADINMHREDYSTALNDYVRAQQLDPSANLKHKIQEARKKEKAAKKKDYYAILGVSKGATDAEIKKAYKTLALKYHPDRNRAKSEVQQQEAAKKFKDISEAHTVLTDPEKRKRYDCGDIEYDGDQGGSGFGGGFGGGDFGSNVKFSFNGQNMEGMGIDPSQIFQMFFSGSGNEGFQGFEGFKSFGGREKRGASKSKGFSGFGGARGFQNFGFS